MGKRVQTLEEACETGMRQNEYTHKSIVHVMGVQCKSGVRKFGYSLRVCLV